MAAPNGHPQDSKSTGERVAKVIARSGLCSRREAEALISDKRVSVNGAIIESAALDILPSDKVLVDGRPLSPREPPRLWRYHKPKGRVTTHKDPEGRPTVFEALPEGLPRLISVGRLDFNTEGLLLLTNDGDLARHLELPATGWTRRYRVRAFGEVNEAQLQDLAGGLTVSGMTYGPIEASLEREQGGNVWLSVSIREGKNREVRRILEHLGLTVNRLIRVSFGPFMLGDLETGQIEEVKTAVLKDQLGPRLSRQLGVKREPVREERRLLPARGKPAHLRREPAVRAREDKQTPGARPLKRRRILEEGGTEAPKIEFVAESRPRRGRSGPDAAPGRKPRFESRKPDREAAFPLTRPLRGHPLPRKLAKASLPFKDSTPASGCGGERVSQRDSPIPSRERGRGEGAWKKSETRCRPGFRRKRPENPAQEADAKSPHRKLRGHQPFARLKNAGVKDTPHFRTFRPDRQGEKQGPPHRVERREENLDFRQRPRDGSEKMGERQRPSFRRSDQSERKPFKARGASRPSSGKHGGEKPADGKAPHGKHRKPLHKPGHRLGPESDKETP
jgi:23S rRNA pseudouridine2605 synthase